MKFEISIIFMSIFLIFGFSFFIFSTQNFGITGFVIENESLMIGENVGMIEINENISKDMALNEIAESESIIQEMKENNFSIKYVNDTLLEAKRAFERARHAEILKDSNSSLSEISESRRVLQLLDWHRITYDDVLIHTNKIKERKNEAFDIFDLIGASEIKLENYEEKGIDIEETKALLNEANNAFYEERYDDTKNLLEEVRNSLETKISQSATLNTLKIGAQNFIQRYWIFLILGIILFGLIGFFSYKKISRNILKKKINKLKIEKNTLLDLMKKTQIERFKENKLSEMIYHIRMDKYKKRINEIKEILPVFKERISSTERKFNNSRIYKE